MQQAFITMLEMQNRMNTRVHPQWVDQDFEWYRAIWIECGELMDHYGYKWWKKQTPDLDQVRLEVIDIWHFGLSALFKSGDNIEQIASQMLAALDGYSPKSVDVREATEALAENSLATKGFCVQRFWDLMQASEISFESLYESYVGKNVLNFFRQDHGYKEGTYVKTWTGREDNEHLVEIIDALDSSNENFADQVYAALAERYQTATSATTPWS